MGLELSLPGQDHSALLEEVKETTALVILALRSVMYISEEEVSRRPFDSSASLSRSRSLSWELLPDDEEGEGVEGYVDFHVCS